MDMRFEVVTAVKMSVLMTIFWDFALVSLVNFNRQRNIQCSA
jgi:hypothetical protein